jgi:hypothetical protein
MSVYVLPQRGYISISLAPPDVRYYIKFLPTTSLRSLLIYPNSLYRRWGVCVLGVLISVLTLFACVTDAIP